ncbi:MAG: ribosome assembly RNA-binding protein YhbY [Desulfocapsaceae bacterium]|nr:ribosome assembly RNA-binding protein YhbY [Desulfocapsaceae bacterium]
MDVTEETETKTLSGKQKKYLKGLGHHLSPVILIGKEGISPQLIEATAQELKNHELIKIKIGNNSTVTKQDAVQTLTTATGGELVQLIGKSLLLYKENPERPKDERVSLA